MERLYELVYILRPDLEDEGRAAATARVAQRIAEIGGTVQRTDDWGKRRLAYPIGKAKEGYYAVVRFNGDGERIAELRRTLGLIEDVVRYLVSAAEPAPKEAVAAEPVAAAPEAGG